MDSDSIDIRKFQQRARLPQYFRFAAAFLIAIVLIGVGIGYFRARSVAEFRMVGFPTELSKDIVASVDGYERHELEGDSVKYYIKADRATTFSDNHQELENVYLQVFDSDGSANEISSKKAIYVPADNKDFTVYFAGNANISTRDGLQLHTEQLTYKRNEGIVSTDEPVKFERSNMRGRSNGVVLSLVPRTLELQREVEFELTDSTPSTHRIEAGSAIYFHNESRAAFANGFDLLTRKYEGPERVNESTHVRAVIANLRLIDAGAAGISIGGFDLSENVKIGRTQASGKTTISSGSAAYDRPGEQYQFADGVVIEIEGSGHTRKISGNKAKYGATAGRIEIAGNALVESGSDWVKGESMNANIRSNGSFESVVVSGGAAMRQVRQNDIVDISSPQLTASFDPEGNALSARAAGGSEIKRNSLSTEGNSVFSILSGNGITLAFNQGGGFDRMVTEGRTTINLETPDNGRDSSNKTIRADNVKSFFNVDGRTLKRAEAIGNAEFTLTPHRPAENNYRITVNSPKLDCDFFASANSLNSCLAYTGAKLVRTPTILRTERGDQVITATSLTARFDEKRGNPSRLDATGKARFTELDRNASSQSFVFTAEDETIRLRGGEPTAWDTRARVKAKEIDWDTGVSRSRFRGSVSTTYYSSKSLVNSSLFSESGKPVYITSETCEMDHLLETARYSGNARAWQGNSYLRASVIALNQKDSTIDADGRVESGLFRTAAGNDAVREPVFASAESMRYIGQAKRVEYYRNVAVRKGNDQITARSAVVLLNDENEMIATDFEQDVNITQPGRKAFAGSAHYTSSDDRIVLKGRPARIEDPAKGSLSGAELTIFFKEKRVLASGTSSIDPNGRSRSTYKVQ